MRVALTAQIYRTRNKPVESTPGGQLISMFPQNNTACIAHPGTQHPDSVVPQILPARASSSLRAVSNATVCEVNVENLPCPAGQRLAQKSGSELNPPPTSRHRGPAPSHSAQRSVEFLLPKICFGRGRVPATADTRFHSVWANLEKICHQSEQRVHQWDAGDWWPLGKKGGCFSLNLIYIYTPNFFIPSISVVTDIFSFVLSLSSTFLEGIILKFVVHVPSGSDYRWLHYGSSSSKVESDEVLFSG